MSRRRKRAMHSWFAPGARCSRRQMLKGSLGGAAGLLLGDHLAIGALPRPSTGRAKAVIQIWMWGGPSHLDTFDPKPEAGEEYCGPLTHPIATNADGIRIGELLPQLARQADKYSLIRSMTHGVNGHETAAYMVQTGHPSGDGLVHPGVGAVVSRFRGRDAGYDSLLPPYIVLTQLQGRFPEAGFLPARYKPFATGGDPARGRFTVEGVTVENISDARQHARRDLLRDLDTLGRTLDDDRRLQAHRECEDAAYDLILGEAGRVFDLEQEKDEVRDRYGRNTLGQSCLMARRLVERGVPYVTINARGWDTHKEHFQIMRRQLPELDRGLGTLLQDLSERGLLDSTVVWCCGEFGRTPKVSWEAPWNGGRGHHGRVFSALVAGGGFRGGQVVGSSDARGEDVAERPVHPRDLLGSIYELLGIDPGGVLPHPDGHLVRMLPSDAVVPATPGLLREILPPRSPA